MIPFFINYNQSIFYTYEIKRYRLFRLHGPFYLILEHRSSILTGRLVKPDVVVFCFSKKTSFFSENYVGRLELLIRDGVAPITAERGTK